MRDHMTSELKPVATPRIRSSDLLSVRLTHLDLFSGIGGFALAAQRAGFETVGFCEKEPYAQKIIIEKFGAILADTEREFGRDTHRNKQTDGHERIGEGKSNRFGGGGCPRLHGDIFGLDGRAYRGVTLITGGFPCQPFSSAGKRRGKEDDRHLWPEMRRIIDEARPTWVLGENVPGIIGMELDNVLSDLENLGYACWPVAVPACAVDAKHRRMRIWIVGYSDGVRSRLTENGQGHHAGNNGDAKRPDELCEPPRPSGEGKENDADSVRPRPLPGSQTGIHRGEESAGSRNVEPERFCRWDAEPGMGRVVDGLPNRAHRLRGLGNAIVPQVAETHDGKDT
jgi:DNA (cytosine-5)-methyltransferase 1